MTWNWQQGNWPKFSFEADKIAPLEAEFLTESGMFFGAYKHVSEDERKLLLIDMISEEAFKTSEIEGERLNRDSIQSSIRRQFGLQAEAGKVPPAEQGIADMMVDLYGTYSQPLTKDMLNRWHSMIMNGRKDIAVIADYRKHEDPMQVVSGYIHKPAIHFEAPPSVQMDKEMKAFIAWFNETSLMGQQALPALTRAALAHLYFVCIHPYEDGNGRIARALTEKALAQNIGQPTMLALSKTIEANRKAYYQALEDNNKSLEITGWLIYFCQTVLDAQKSAAELMDFVMAKSRFFDKFKDQLNKRQEKAILRIFKEGPDGFEGGLSRENYISITGAAPATATRDLSDLVDKEALKKTGELKGTRYWLMA